jgi:hypothetical protein
MRFGLVGMGPRVAAMAHGPGLVGIDEVDIRIPHVTAAGMDAQCAASS